VTKVKEKSYIINAAEGVERPYDERRGVASMDTAERPPSDDAERNNEDGVAKGVAVDVTCRF
jgi:hypothetical protein